MNEDELTVEERIQRGRIARRLLEEPVLADAFLDAKNTFVEAWLAGNSVELRDAAWAKIHALDEVRLALHRIIAEGEYAESMLQRRQ